MNFKSPDKTISLFHQLLFNMIFFIKDMHEAFKSYLYYPPKIEDNFTHNPERLSIYGKKKMVAILKLSYAPETKVA